MKVQMKLSVTMQDTILDLAALNEMVQAKMLVKEERKNFGIFPLFDNNIGKMAATTAIFHIQSSL